MQRTPSPGYRSASCAAVAISVSARAALSGTSRGRVSGFVAVRWPFFERKAAEARNHKGKCCSALSSRRCVNVAMASQVPLALLVTGCTDRLGRQRCARVFLLVLARTYSAGPRHLSRGYAIFRKKCCCSSAVFGPSTPVSTVPLSAAAPGKRGGGGSAIRKSTITTLSFRPTTWWYAIGRMA
jgi:hypothetical protein